VQAGGSLRSGRGDNIPTFFGPTAAERCTLRLNRCTPLALTINAGASSNTIDLSQLQVTNLRLNPGVGSTVVILPAAGRLQATVIGGVGQATVHIPSGMAARIHAGNGLGQTSEQDSFQRVVDNWFSPDFDTAANPWELGVNSGIGAV
jgi:hypothetical protein